MPNPKPQEPLTTATKNETPQATEPPKKKSNKTVIIIVIVVVVFLSLIILGACSTIMLTAVKSARDKARDITAYNAGRGVLPAILFCKEKKGTILQPEIDGRICTSDEEMGIWPELPEGYSFSQVANPSTNNWTFIIMHEDDGEIMRCDKEKCNEIDI